ncbi:hypothetical protein ACFOY2_39750 [Nonomuraea purpurea]|uniref:Uncharacterized protein n=1 Tax=Nonomuraea purpurea TaxID=1849276 RepID=A0ABV8GHJ9_9ACTN
MADKPGKTETGRCCACGRTFTYDPGEVMTVLIDPQTGLPPGFSVLGTLRPAGPEAVARSADQPVCPACVDRAASLKAADDPPPFPTWP